MIIKVERECCEREDLLTYNGAYDGGDEDITDITDMTSGSLRFCRYCGQQWFMEKAGVLRKVYPWRLGEHLVPVQKPLPRGKALEA